MMIQVQEPSIARIRVCQVRVERCYRSLETSEGQTFDFSWLGSQVTGCGEGALDLGSFNVRGLSQ